MGLSQILFSTSWLVCSTWGNENYTYDFFLTILFFTLDNMYLNKTSMVFKVDYNCLNDHYLFTILLFLIFTFKHRKLSTFQTQNFQHVF